VYMSANAQVPMVQTASTPTKGPPIGLIIGGVVLIVVIIVIVLWQTGVFKSEPDAVSSGPGPSPGPMAPGPAPGPTQYTTGSQNITALISEMNGVFGSRVSNCPNVIQQLATWYDSQGMIIVPQGTSCPSSAPIAAQPSRGVVVCSPQNVHLPLQPPDAIATLLTQCMQAGAPPPRSRWQTTQVKKRVLSGPKD